MKPVDPKAAEMWISGLGEIALELKDKVIAEKAAEIKRLRTALKVARNHVPDGYALDIVDAALVQEKPNDAS